jgi:SAM-dependent methyltransferase
VTTAIQELFYSREAFSRQDEGEDCAFYQVDRFVPHLDSLALSTVEKLIGALIVEEAPAVLDLMASWDSHLPSTLRPARVAGLGLNESELARNARLSERIVHDLNRDPVLPFTGSEFDAVLCTVSVDYLTRPFEVFEETARVLRPGGLLLVAFSNRYFPQKVVKIWRDSSEAERILLVEDYFRAAGCFTAPRTWISQGKPRPRGDRYADRGIPSDPVYAVFAEREGGTPDRPDRTPPDLDLTPFDSDRLAQRRKTIGRTLTCPYCDSPLRKWAVPQTPFTEYDAEFMYVCFDDRCPFLVRGWDTMSRQGNRGLSCRFSYDPDRDACLSLPVPSLGALRESIVEE